ncbi:MAG: rhomboid family intramembrane serine protease, partial [Micropruina sp.]|uniref:rhomboid family intramembrane serine protease n=1 Tax=Micropruina sp. TaxID=2737536 RepID=UPI0039E4B7E7
MDYPRRPADPRLTSLVLIGGNVAVYLLILATGGWASLWVNRLGISPLGMCLLDDGSGRYYPGSDAAACATLPDTVWLAGAADGAWWQVLTNAFTHADPIHLLGNLLALWYLGPPLEQAVGRLRFLTIYGLGVLGASAAVLWLSDPDSTALGASGAIFAMLGALLVLARRFGGNYQLIAVFLAVNIVITVVGGSHISWQGHLGGLLAGLAAGAALALPRRRHPAGP